MDTAPPFDLCGDHLAVNFANTMSERLTGKPVDHLDRFEDLVRFLRQSKVLSTREAERRAAWGRSHKKEAEQVLQEARTLREALFRIFSALIDGHPPVPEDLTALNHAASRLQLDPAFRWVWSGGEEAPDSLLAPVVRAAVDLLTSPERARVRVCDADDCAWLFLDTSKNHSRRWCDMSSCGNRAKAKRFADRH